MIVSSAPLVVAVTENKTEILFSKMKKHHNNHYVEASLLVLSTLLFLLSYFYCQILQDAELQYLYVMRQF